MFQSWMDPVRDIIHLEKIQGGNSGSLTRNLMIGNQIALGQIQN